MLIMVTNEEEEQTSIARGDQEISGNSDDSHGSRGMEAVGGSTGAVDVRTSRADWETSNLPLCLLLGGIVKQLLESEKQRLSEVEECVVWYERERDIVKSRIEELEQLQQQAEQSANQLADLPKKLELTEQ
jgi:hypothetical protein